MIFSSQAVSEHAPALRKVSGIMPVPMSGTDSASAAAAVFLYYHAEQLDSTVDDIRGWWGKDADM